MSKSAKVVLGSKAAMPRGRAACYMSFEDDLHRIEGHVAEARRLVQRQKGLITRLRAAGVDTWGCSENTFASGIEPSAIGRTQGPPQRPAKLAAPSLTPAGHSA